MKTEDCSGVDTSQEMPKIASKSAEVGQGHASPVGFGGDRPGQGRGERIWGNRANLFFVMHSLV